MKAEVVSEAQASHELPRGRLRQHKSVLGFFHRVADAFAIMGALALAGELTGQRWSVSVAAFAATAAVLFYLFAEFKNLYRSRRVGNIRDEMGSVLESWLGMGGVCFLIVFLHKDALVTHREMLIAWFVATPAALCGFRLMGRLVLRSARARGLNTRRLAIVGSGDFDRYLAKMIEQSPWMGFRIVGLFDNRRRQVGDQRITRGEVRSLDALVRLARHGGVDVIYITLTRGALDPRMDELLQRLSDTTISVYLLHDRRFRRDASEAQPDNLLHLPSLHRCRVDIGGIPAISVYETPFLGPEGWFKRIEDIVVSATALLLLAPPMLVIAIGVKLSGPGPVLFRQRRYGLDGRQIKVLKFRSMTVCDDGSDIAQASRSDPRVTRFGAFLRRTSLDELPQFINVLQGTMSVVGPRPHAVAHNEYYRSLVGGYMLRHKVKPGITGWAQVNGFRGETQTLDKMRRRVEFDLDYIRGWSLLLDTRIILSTLLHGFVDKNAY